MIREQTGRSGGTGKRSLVPVGFLGCKRPGYAGYAGMTARGDMVGKVTRVREAAMHPTRSQTQVRVPERDEGGLCPGIGHHGDVGYLDGMAHRGIPIHPSHITEQDEDAPDPHSPGWRCTICRQYACALCDLKEGDDLAEPCPGKPWWEAP